LHNYAILIGSREEPAHLRVVIAVLGVIQHRLGVVVVRDEEERVAWLRRLRAVALEPLAGCRVGAGEDDGFAVGVDNVRLDQVAVGVKEADLSPG